jgi:hypothetical protein
MVVMCVPLARIDGVPEPDEGSPVFLHDMVSPPALAPPGAITTRNERYASTAALSQGKNWESGRQIADDAGSDRRERPLAPRLSSPVAGGLVPRIVVVPRVSSRLVRPATLTDRPCRAPASARLGQPPSARARSRADSFAIPPASPCARSFAVCDEITPHVQNPMRLSKSDGISKISKIFRG